MATSASPSAAPRVLLVDDHDERRRQLASLLPHLQTSMTLLEATSPQTLDLLLREAPFDLALVADDFDGGGLQTARHISRGFLDRPVLVLASDGKSPVLSELLQAGVTDYLSPDAWRNADRLMAAIQSAFERAQPLRLLRQREENSRRDADRLKQANADLEWQIGERTRVAETRTHQLRILASELTKAEEKERRRLAQMLHDDLQQMLVAARMHISAIPEDANRQRVDDALRHVDDLVDRSIRLSRNLTVRFSPPILYDAGLAPALEWLARQVEEEHGLEVEVDCDDTAQPEAQDNVVLLYQAVRELLFNVLKHAGVPRAKVSMHHAGEGDVQVSVCDEGKGFEADIFESADSLRSGFGLFSIRERLELVRGRMEIESIPGQGTCVRLYAPLDMTDEERAGSQTVQSTLMALEKEKEPNGEVRREPEECIRVLLADDHRIMRASLAGLLRTQPGIEVVGQAADGQQVIDMARSLRPDVVVMDITMPVVDGVEATRVLTGEMAEMAIIALSMHEKEDMQQAMRAAGASRYLTKDGPPELLVAAIRSSARQRKLKQSPRTKSPTKRG